MRNLLGSSVNFSNVTEQRDLIRKEEKMARPGFFLTWYHATPSERLGVKINDRPLISPSLLLKNGQKIQEISTQHEAKIE